MIARLLSSFVFATAVIAGAACSTGEAPQTAPPSAPTICSTTYPAGPYGVGEGEVLADLVLDGIDASGNPTKTFAHESYAPCGGAREVLALRVVAGFCGTCRWHAGHLGESLGEALRERVRLVDIVVRDDDGEPPAASDAKTWQSRQDRKSAVIVDPSTALLGRGTPLPRIVLVDPRTMVSRRVLDDPSPGDLASAVAGIVSELDGRSPPSFPAPARFGGGLFDKRQWDMLRDMRLLSGGPPRDPTNRVGDDEVAGELGRLLFDERALSPSGVVSCERCHERGRAFTDGSETATGGVRGATRNTPSVVLSGWSRWQLWDGRADSLWAQALLPMEAPTEFGSSRLFVAHRVYELQRAFYERVFGPMPPLDDLVRFPPSGRPGDPAWEAMAPADRDLVTGVFVNVGKAMAAFERSFRATELPYEAFLRGDEKALDAKQKEGIVAFFESGCAQCHWGNRMTDDAFHVVRFPTGRDDLVADRGRVDAYAKLAASEFRTDGRWSDATVVRAKMPTNATLGAFKTPSLRGVALTRPYGHGGSVPSLDDAVELHRAGGMPADSRLTVGDAEPWLVSFDASRTPALVAFLSTLGLGFVR